MRQIGKKAVTDNLQSFPKLKGRDVEVIRDKAWTDIVTPSHNVSANTIAARAMGEIAWKGSEDDGNNPLLRYIKNRWNANKKIKEEYFP
jgi:hypothetical protein